MEVVESAIVADDFLIQTHLQPIVISLYWCRLSIRMDANRLEETHDQALH